ncbi:MAG: hypothetical protein ABSB78_09515 [Bacteroidota bacterium]
MKIKGKKEIKFEVSLAVLVSVSALILLMRYIFPAWVHMEVSDLILELLIAFIIFQGFISIRMLRELGSDITFEIIENLGELFATLRYHTKHAKQRIDTMMISESPAALAAPEMITYFSEIKKIICRHRDLNFRRVVTINSMDKLKWVHKLLDDFKDCPNYHMRWLQTHTLTTPLMAVHIVDERLTVLFKTIRPDGIDRSILIRSEDVTRCFQEYFEAVWNASIPLKEGGQVFPHVLDEFESNLTQQRTRSKRAISK